MAQSAATPARVAPLFVSIAGLVAGVRQREANGAPFFLTLVKVPSTDPMRGPATFELQSKKRLGQRGQEVDVVCELTGYPNNYKTRDGEAVNSAQHVLRVREDA